MPQAISKVGHCLSCEYDLRGITTCVCPECGRAFDPADARTLRIAGVGHPGLLSRWLIRPPGVIWSLLAAVVCLHMLWRARMPGSDVLIEGLAALGACAARLVGWYLTGQRFPDHCPDRIKWHRFAIPPLLVLLSLAAAQVTFQVAMAISRPAMEEMAQRAMDARYQPNVNYSGWAGIYHIDGIHFDGNPIYPEEGTAQLICTAANAVYIIEDVHAGNPPRRHGRTYWRSGLWIRMSVE